MRKCFAFILFALLVAVLHAAPHRVVLVVQNHCSGKTCPPMSAFSDTLVAELSGRQFRVVNPDNVIGVNQNRSPAGEERPEMSAAELARTLDAAGVITASVQEFTGDSIGMPPVAYRVKARISLNLADAASGEAICGVNTVEFGKNVSADLMKEDDLSIFESQIHDAARKAAAKFLAKIGTVGWAGGGDVAKVKVFFGCNVLGADVQIDGLSYGTCPAEIEVTPGIHMLEVSYLTPTNSWYHPFKRKARFVRDGQTYAVVLQMTPEGAAERQKSLEKEADLKERSGHFASQMKLAEAMLGRYKKSGAVDDYVRKTIADGTSIYWKNSFGRIVITDGKADNIEFATPSTDTGDIVYPPDATEISDGLGKLLKANRK